MISRFAMGVALVALAGCGAPSIPDSNPSRGVGFGNYSQYQAERAQRDAILAGRAEAVAQPMSEEVLIAQETMDALGQPGAAPSVETTTVAAVTPATGNPTISDEQNFDAVASRETIESDRERLARRRDTFQTAQPEAVPERPSGPAAPNIVTYALATTNPVGQPAL